MKILIAHNRYQERGGEDHVVAEEATLLEKHGHEVELFLVDNDAINNPLRMARAALSSFYGVRRAKQFSACLDSFTPDLVHVHNFMPSLSPSIFFAAKRERVPVVQTLHNYRLLCANAQFFRDGQVCEECLSARSFLPGVQHACYRSSRIGSAVVGASMALHAMIGTWTDRIDRYIALTRFTADKLSIHRVPSDRIRIKPNFVRDTALGTGDGGYALFAGRLSPEKGLQTLIDADKAGLFKLPIHVAGEGSMMPELREAASRRGSQLRLRGAISRAEMQEQMRSASVLLVPSIWYEPCPMVVIEALAAGLPVVCSAIGGLPELVTDGVTGFTCKPSDSVELAKKANYFTELTADVMHMRHAAREHYDTEFSEARNYDLLMQIYSELFKKSRAPDIDYLSGSKPK